MSFFDRLKSNFSGSDAADSAPAVAAQAPAEVGARYFMGKEEAHAMRRADRAAPERVVERGLEAPGEIWVFVCPTTQRLSIVPALGVAEGELMSNRMLSDLQRIGFCEEVSYHAGYDQYWKMPTQTAILRMPSLHGVPTPLLNRIKLSTQLVKPGEPRGFWMRVRLREASELPAANAAEDQRTI